MYICDTVDKFPVLLSEQDGKFIWQWRGDLAGAELASFVYSEMFGLGT